MLGAHGACCCDMTSDSNPITNKVPLREVLRGVAQGHIIFITTGRNGHSFAHVRKKIARKSKEFAFYPQHFLGVLNSSIYSAFWVLEIDVPTTDLLLRNCTTQKTFAPYS